MNLSVNNMSLLYLLNSYSLYSNVSANGEEVDVSHEQKSEPLIVLLTNHGFHARGFHGIIDVPKATGKRTERQVSY